MLIRRVFRSIADGFYQWISGCPEIARLVYWCLGRGEAAYTNDLPSALDVIEQLERAADPVDLDNSLPSAKSDFSPGKCWKCGSERAHLMIDCPDCGAAYDGTRTFALRAIPNTNGRVDDRGSVYEDYL